MKRTLKESDKKRVAFNQKWHCASCESLLPSTYQIDHIIPFSISANDTINNLEALCPNCHSIKTQKESFRIARFKKLCSTKSQNLCWFCLEIDTDTHLCNKKIKQITIPKRKYDHALKINTLDKLIYTTEDNNGKKDDKDFENDILKIKLQPDFIWINNFFTEVENKEDYTPERILRAIFVATRSKKFSNKFRSVEIDVNIEPDEENPDDLIDYLEEEIHKNITKRIFIDPENIEYTFIC